MLLLFLRLRGLFLPKEFFRDTLFGCRHGVRGAQDGAYFSRVICRPASKLTSGAVQWGTVNTRKRDPDHILIRGSAPILASTLKEARLITGVL